MPELGRTCKEELIFLKDGILEETEYEDLLEIITNEANFVNYLPDQDFPSKLDHQKAFRVWEWKDEESLALVADLSEVDRIRKMRVCTRKMLTHLLKLINLIEEVLINYYYNQLELSLEQKRIQ